MLKSKSTVDREITEQIESMNFHDKCQTKLDHKTCLELAKNGYKQEAQRKLRHGKNIPALREMVKKPQEWIRFFLDRPLDWWDQYIPESHFQVWIENRFFSPEPHFAGDNWWTKKS